MTAGCRQRRHSSLSLSVWSRCCIRSEWYIEVQTNLFTLTLIYVENKHEPRIKRTKKKMRGNKTNQLSKQLCKTCYLFVYSMCVCDWAKCDLWAHFPCLPTQLDFGWEFQQFSMNDHIFTILILKCPSHKYFSSWFLCLSLITHASHDMTSFGLDT